MLRSYGIEWEEIQEFESSRYAVDTGLSGQELFNYTYQRMADFYKITLPNSIAGSSGSAIGDPSNNTVIGDPNSGIVFTS